LICTLFVSETDYNIYWLTHCIRRHILGCPGCISVMDVSMGEADLLTVVMRCGGTNDMISFSNTLKDR